MPRRTPLSRSRIVDAAVAVADASGLHALSMRHIAKNLGVEAMSLYHHIANKEDLLDELTEWFFSRVEVPAADVAWRDAMSHRAHSIRGALRDHPWALGLIESRSQPGPANLQQHESVLANLSHHGFTHELAAHAFSVIDAYIFGFVLTEVNIPVGEDTTPEEFVENLQTDLAAFPHLRARLENQVLGRTYNYGDEFAYGLELILDGLARRLSETRT